jgi:error-prone DNA polymerase
MPYAELHAKSNFSFLQGASHPEELVARAAELGYAALALTDRNSLAGVVRAHGAAKERGLKLVIGAEIAPADAPPLVLWATDRAAYGRLARLITRGCRRVAKGQCRLGFADVAEHAAGLLAGAIVSRLWLRNGEAAEAARYRELFGDRGYLLAELHYGGDDRHELERLQELSRQCGLPLAAAGDVYYHVPERQALGDVLCALRWGTTVRAAGRRLFPNAQRHLRSIEEMTRLFRQAPQALLRTVEIAQRTAFSLDELRYEYPQELVPPGQTPGAYLARLAWEGARGRYPGGVPEKVRRLLEHELRLIEELGYEAYFLTVWDLVSFARRRGILCQGRGSAANSAVCFALGITSVDPERMDVLFERFVSRERNEAPDIDVDFEHERREEVLQYLYAKYGRERAGMTAEVITYRPRSAIRDVGRALGLPAEAIDRLAKQIDHFHAEKKGSRDEQFQDEPDLPRRCRQAGIDPAGTQGRQLIELVGQLVGFPRHLSQHTGGMVISRGPLSELVPIENAAMPGRTVIQWNKDDLDELGILKVDCLALGMLTAIRKCFALLREHASRELTLAGVPEGDPEVYAMIRRADTMGVFQIESRAQMSMLPRLRPRSFYDLVIEVAIVRPGPIQGHMVHPYLRRRNGEEPVVYPNAVVRRVLEKTLGVPLFQEQAMRLAVEGAGFTPGEADQLRRAMGAWRRPGLIDQFRKRLLDGMLRHGFTPEYAEAVFRQIRGFGDYGFPESHAASFALLVYVSAWLKHHYPAAFAAALLNSQPLGFYAPAQLVRDARQHGVQVLPVDVNRSEWDCTLEKGLGIGDWGLGHCVWRSPLEMPLATRRSGLPTQPEDSSPKSQTPNPQSLPSLRLGFRLLHGMARGDARRIVAARGGREFHSTEDFARRTGLGRAAILRLAQAGALGSLTLDRRHAVWEALDHDPRALPLFEGKGDRRLLCDDHASKVPGHRAKLGRGPFRQKVPVTFSPFSPAAAVALPPMSPAEEVLADYRTAGLSLHGHPLGFLRGELDRLGVLPAAQLSRLRLRTGDNAKPQAVRVAGLVLVRQRPATAKGITFITLEDETGTVNLIVRLGVWKRYRAAALGAVVLLAQGHLQRQQGSQHVVATRLEDLTSWLGGIASQSRDFC